MYLFVVPFSCDGAVLGVPLMVSGLTNRREEGDMQTLIQTLEPFWVMLLRESYIHT